MESVKMRPGNLRLGGGQTTAPQQHGGGHSPGTTNPPSSTELFVTDRGGRTFAAMLQLTADQARKVNGILGPLCSHMEPLAF